MSAFLTDVQHSRKRKRFDDGVLYSKRAFVFDDDDAQRLTD